MRSTSLLVLFSIGCAGDPKPSPEETGETGTTDPEVDTFETGAELTPTLAADWCEAVVAGAAGGDDPTLELSRLHNAVRMFSAAVGWEEADAALIEALAGETWDAETALVTYGDAVGGCVLPAAERSLPAASVTLQDGVAIVAPGSGAVEIPAAASALVLDLRGLPQGAETEAALEVALAAVLSGEQTISYRKIRSFDGFPGAVTDGGVYSSSARAAAWTVSGALPAPLPLIVWTERALPPEAARVAGALRMSGAALLVGHPVWTAAAESWWSPVGAQGLLWPAWAMQVEDEPWPDLIPADLETDDPAAHLAEALSWGDPGTVTGETTRPVLGRFTQAAADPSTTLNRGSARAMLMTAHGLLDRFFPYFDVVGYTHDDALSSALAEVDALEEGDRAGAKVALGRFMHALQDGHGFFGDWAGSTSYDSYMAIQVERVDGWPVVRSSGTEEVLAGDVILEINGVPSDEFYEEAMAWHSAATPGYLFEVSGRDWLNSADPAALRVRGVDGEEREVEISGVTYEEMSALVPWGGTLRPSGWLDDLGASGIYLLNLNGEVTTTDEAWQSALDEAAGAAGLVVDMRDYPAVNHYAVAQALRSGPFASPTFKVKTWTRPDTWAWDESVYDLEGEGTVTCPIVLLVSNKSVSAAENFSMMLWDDENITVVGQQSAGTNGNITATYLPGGYYFYFTGMRVLNPDGSELHGVGIPLDVEVAPTPEDYAAGIDPELEAAISVLTE